MYSMGHIRRTIWIIQNTHGNLEYLRIWCREKVKYLFLSILSLAWPESHMAYTMWRKRTEVWRSWLGFSQWGEGDHSKFRVIPQSPVQFVTDPVCRAFDLVVSVEVWESSFYECLHQAWRLSNVRMEIWGLWLMLQSRPPSTVFGRSSLLGKGDAQCTPSPIY